MPQAPLTDGSAVRRAAAPLLTSSATSRASDFNALSLSSDLQNGHNGWPRCLGLRHRERRGRTGDAQLGALGRQLAPRHQPGQRFRWRPPFPLARPRPAGRESEPGSEILRPHSLVSFSQTLRIALQTLLAPCPSEPSFIQQGRLRHWPWTGSALSREDRAANKIRPHHREDRLSPQSHPAGGERPHPRPSQDPVWARGEGAA